MTQPPENEPKEACSTSDDPNSWLYRVKLLFERSVLACSQLIDFTNGLIATEQLSTDDQFRCKMMPTEMIVAMHNLRVGIQDALLALAAFGLPADLREGGNKIFTQEENPDLTLLFQRVVEESGPEGFLPVGKVQLPSDLGVTAEQYQGSLAFLKEMADKYQQYDFENVPTAMAGACRKKDKISDSLAKAADQKESCSHLQNPQPASVATVDPDEMMKYQKMCAELIEDANTIYGQFCAVGSIYRAAIPTVELGQD